MKIKEIYWKIFYSIYYYFPAAKYENSEIDAFYLLSLIFYINIMTIANFFRSVAPVFKSNLKGIALVTALFSLILNWLIIFNKMSGYKKNKDNFKYLLLEENKKTKMKYIFIPIISTLILMTFGLLLAMKKIL